MKNGKVLFQVQRSYFCFAMPKLVLLSLGTSTGRHSLSLMFKWIPVSCPVTGYHWGEPSLWHLSWDTLSFLSMLSDIFSLPSFGTWRILLSFPLSQKHLINILFIFESGFWTLKYPDIKEWNLLDTKVFLYCSHGWLLLRIFIFLLHFPNPLYFLTNNASSIFFVCM